MDNLRIVNRRAQCLLRADMPVRAQFDGTEVTLLAFTVCLCLTFKAKTHPTAYFLR